MGYIGRALGFVGDGSEAQLAGVEQVLAQALDLRNDTMKVVYPFSGTTPELYDAHLSKHLQGSVQGHYTKFEGWLAGTSTAFFVGTTVTAGDFHVWEMLDQHEAMAAKAGLPSPLANFPKLAAFYAAFKALPHLKAYF